MLCSLSGGLQQGPSLHNVTKLLESFCFVTGKREKVAEKFGALRTLPCEFSSFVGDPVPVHICFCLSHGGEEDWKSPVLPAAHFWLGIT